MPKRKFSAKQLAAQRRFAEMARAGRFRKGKSRSKPAAIAAVKGGTTMAKRRRNGSARFGRRVKRYAGRAAGSTLGMAAAGVAYGFTRPYVSRLIAPITEKIPVGGILADNIAIFGAAYVAKKFIKNPLARRYLDAAMIAEAVLAGMDLSVNGTASWSGQTPKSTAVSSGNSVSASS